MKKYPNNIWFKIAKFIWVGLIAILLSVVFLPLFVSDIPNTPAVSHSDPKVPITDEEKYGDYRINYKTNYHLINFENIQGDDIIASIGLNTEPTILDMNDINLQAEFLKNKGTLPKNYKGYISFRKYNPDGGLGGSAEQVYYLKQIDPNAPNAPKPKAINIGIPEGTLPGN